MLSRPRAIAALLVASLMLSTTPAFAGNPNDVDNNPSSVNAVFDIVFLRPLGLATTVMGVALFGAIAPFVAMTRPQDFRKPLNVLVVAPAKFTWGDPIGQH